MKLRALIVSCSLLLGCLAGCSSPTEVSLEVERDLSGSLEADMVVDQGSPDLGAAPSEMGAADLEEFPDQSIVEDQGLDRGVPDEGLIDMEAPDMEIVSRVPTDRPLRVLFVGNSFTFQGPVPYIMRDLATDAGWITPDVRYSAFGGETLRGHRGRDQTLDLIDEGSWDVVVIQEFSTGPTDNIGNPERFKEDATWFYDRIKASSPDAMIWLYMTWARHPDHGIYPGSFSDPAEMQAQLRSHYLDAAERYIPTNATAMPPDDVAVSPVGDAWEAHLAEPDPLRLHGSDDYHAGAAGRYLNGLMHYAMIYHRRTDGRSGLGFVTPSEAARLQRVVDSITGHTTPGGPSGMEVPGLDPQRGIFIDFGSVVTTEPGWNNVTGSTSGSASNLLDDQGTTTRIDVAVTDAFAGSNSNGVTSNALGFPSDATQDTLWIGSFDGHQAALSALGQVTLSELDPAARYRIGLFASRTGTDSGNGRLTRFQVGSEWVDLEAADNDSSLVLFEQLAPSPDGTIVLDVRVSPAGSSRFGYLNAMTLERLP